MMSRQANARTYTDELRAEAVGLASTVGAMKAADTLGIPRRTVNYWVNHWTHRDAGEVQAAEATIAARLKAAHAVALKAVLAGLEDPKARLGDRAQALRVLGEQAQLAQGRATSRSESVNLNVHVEAEPLTYVERARLQRYLDELTADAESGDPERIARVDAFIRDTTRTEQRGRVLIDGGMTPDAAIAQLQAEITGQEASDG